MKCAADHQPDINRDGLDCGVKNIRAPRSGGIRTSPFSTFMALLLTEMN
jgi:hypothetical protein